MDGGASGLSPVWGGGTEAASIPLEILSFAPSRNVFERVSGRATKVRAEKAEVSLAAGKEA